MKIDNKYDIGQTVYLKTDKDQLERIITSIQISYNNLLYRLSCVDTETWHYDFELSDEKNYQA